MSALDVARVARPHGLRGAFKVELHWAASTSLFELERLRLRLPSGEEREFELESVVPAGKALLVNFWASWCVPCRAEMPALDRLAAEENDDGFMVLPINLDLGAGGLDKARAFLAEGAWPNLPLFADSTFESFKTLQASAVALGLPSTLLLDKNGCELGVLQGPAEWDSTDGINVIEALKSI